MTKFDSTTDRQYPEQFDKNLLCTHENGEFRFPARASIAMTHLLARGNAEDVDNFDAIVIGVDVRMGKPFISTTLDPIQTIIVLQAVTERMAGSVLRGGPANYLKDADPESSPRGEKK
jgi:hypothetical protein